MRPLNSIQIIAFILCLFLGTLVPAFSVQAQPLTGEQREQYVQRAVQLREQENYGAAIAQLDSILSRQPNEAGILLFKGDLQLQSKLYGDAVATYRKLLPLKFEPTITRINLSYALFMNHQPARALDYARMAWQENKSSTNAIVNYFNAQLWNLQTKQAAAFLKTQEAMLSASQLLVLKARLYTTSGNYQSGLKYYDSLCKSTPEKYYVQEYAEVLLGKKENALSAATMKQHEQLFTANEYRAYTQKLQAERQQNIGTEFVLFKDVAQNTRLENRVWWQQRGGGKFRLGLSAGYSSITSADQMKTSAQFVHATVAEKWSRAWSGETELHLQRIKPGNEASYSGLTGQQSIRYQPNDRRMFGAFYSSEILNYTASLLGANIRSHSMGYMTHILATGKTGFYSQGSFGTLTDHNKRMQVFASVYHLFRTEPTLKGGVNFSWLHYADSSIKTYFSPNRYMNTEVFADYSTALPNTSKFYLQAQAAAGMQRIESQKWEPAFRFQTELGYRYNHLELAMKYQTSNVASNTGTGYKFNWITMRAVWKW